MLQAGRARRAVYKQWIQGDVLPKCVTVQQIKHVYKGTAMGRPVFRAFNQGRRVAYQHRVTRQTNNGRHTH